jgi:CRAL/TRIO domain
VFYMRCCRYFPKQTSTDAIIDNLAYCMQTMCEKEKASRDGIGFLAYMNDWHMENFSITYCLQFMMMLQGRVPVRVRMFLIVNPPSWFDTIWRIMKPMLAKEFRKKVHVIPESRLHEFLEAGFETYLPNDVAALGKANTDELVKDFVAYCKKVEE